jgi:hypothetical protein
MSETGASDELIELVFAALDHGIGSVSSSGGPLIPFILTEDEEGRRLARFVAETLEESLAQARRQAASSDAVRVAIAYDGYLTVEGEPMRSSSRHRIAAARRLSSSPSGIGRAAGCGSSAGSAIPPSPAWASRSSRRPEDARGSPVAGRTDLVLIQH